MRALAVGLVLWVHLPADGLGATLAAARSWVIPGYLGVDLFFVLSGFLITRILLVDRERGVPLRYFLFRRFLRIFPIYYLVVFGLQVVSPAPAAEFWACVLYYANYAFTFMPGFSRLEHVWSLAVEEHFYLVWPPIAAYLSPRISRRVILFGLFPLALGSGLLILWNDHWNPPGAPHLLTLRGSTTRFGSLALGALVAYHEIGLRSRPRRALALAGGLLLVAGALSTDGLFARGRLMDLVADGGREARRVGIFLRLISVPLVSLAAVLFAISQTGTRSLLGALLRALVLRGVGRISYGLYLYHFPIYRWLRIDREPPFSPRIGLAVGACFAVAIASYVVVERPLLRYARRFRGPAGGGGGPIAPTDRSG